MKALVDRHHSDLYYAIQRLFEDRLQLPVYTPVGREWWDEGYWRFGEVYGDERLVNQFLVPHDGIWTPTAYSSRIYETRDGHHPERIVRGVTLDAARQSGDEWGLVVATVQENQRGFRRFADEVGAKYAVWVGNVRQDIDASLDPIVLDLPQEFDHTSTFRFREPVRQDRVTSFVNLLPLIPEAWLGFDGLRSRMPEYEFASFGHACPDGFRDPASALADEMAQAGWAYHDKVTGDGFGHVIHNWAAIGRPLIGHSRYYEGQRAAPFWQDGVTCIDLDRHSLDEAAEIIRTTSPAKHAAMCRAIRAVFDTVYDPDAVATEAKRLLA